MATVDKTAIRQQPTYSAMSLAASWGWHSGWTSDDVWPSQVTQNLLPVDSWQKPSRLKATYRWKSRHSGSREKAMWIARVEQARICSRQWMWKGQVSTCPIAVPDRLRCVGALAGAAFLRLCRFRSTSNLSKRHVWLRLSWGSFGPLAEPTSADALGAARATSLSSAHPALREELVRHVRQAALKAEQPAVLRTLLSGSSNTLDERLELALYLARLQEPGGRNRSCQA